MSIYASIPGLGDHGDDDQVGPATTGPAMAELARARQELAKWLYKGVTGSRVHERVAQLIDDHQSAVKDAQAHQLAEQQRGWLRSQGYDTSCICESCSACLAREYIDLIDPEVQR